MKLCFATNNAHKLEEVKLLLGNEFELLTLEDIGCTEDIEETADTIEGNSLLKARYVFDKYNVPCFADDSGLEVLALNNAPGVYSARYGGEHGNHLNNNELLLKNLKNITNRKARFKAVISLVTAAEQVQFEGIVEGKIGYELRGDMGFGYDPLFIPDGYEQTFAELSTEHKNTFSHRGRAMEKLIIYLKNYRTI